MPWAVRSFLLLTLVAFLLSLYVGQRILAAVRLLWPAAEPVARRVRFGLIAWLCLLPVVMLVAHVLGRTQDLFLFSSSAGWMDYVFHYPVWCGIIVAIELVAPTLFFDILGLVSRLSRQRHEQRKMFLAWLQILITLVVLLYVPLRAWRDTTMVRDTETHIAINGLPQELRGIRCVLLSDLQVDRYTGNHIVEQMQAIAAAHAPHFVFYAGDAVTGGREFIGAAAKALCTVRGSVGNVAVMGDHDYWSSPEGVRGFFLRCGWAFEENAHRVFTVHGRTILVTGLTHVYSNKMRESEIRQFLAQAPPADVKILLVHQPAEQVVRCAREAHYQLVLAGHTHGGQIVVHPFGLPITPSKFETRYYTGNYAVEGTTVVVTNGLGLTLAPLRYHARAEVTTVVLE
jgi:uncharacterized protein